METLKDSSFRVLIAVCCGFKPSGMLCCVFGLNTYPNTRSVRKVSSHFEYLENRSRGFDVTWQPIREDLTVHPWTVTFPWD
jgi:hypothetical protein